MKPEKNVQLRAELLLLHRVSRGGSSGGGAGGRLMHSLRVAFFFLSDSEPLLDWEPIDPWLQVHVMALDIGLQHLRISLGLTS